MTTAKMRAVERANQKRMAHALGDARRTGRQIVIGDPIPITLGREPKKAQTMAARLAEEHVDPLPPDPEKALAAVRKALGLPDDADGARVTSTLEAVIRATEENAPEIVEQVARRLGLSEREIAMLNGNSAEHVRAYAARKASTRRTR